MKSILLVIAVYNAINSSSYAQSLGETDFVVPPDETNEDVDEDSRSASSAKGFGAAAMPTSSRLLLPTGPTRPHECYICTDCPILLGNTTLKACPYSADTSKNNKCVVYSEQYRQMKKPWYIRGCASERGSCMDISRAHSSHGDIVKLNFCHECEGDKCNVNGGDRPPATLVTYFVLVVTPVLAKYAL